MLPPCNTVWRITPKKKILNAFQLRCSLKSVTQSSITRKIFNNIFFMNKMKLVWLEQNICKVKYETPAHLLVESTSVIHVWKQLKKSCFFNYFNLPDIFPKTILPLKFKSFYKPRFDDSRLNQVILFYVIIILCGGINDKKLRK